MASLAHPQLQKVLDAYRQSFGEEFPDSLLPDSQLCGEDAFPDGLLVGTEAAAQDPRLVQAFILGPAPKPGYFLMGFWGYGANSYAFYYQRVEADRSVLFRLAYGGFYMDNEIAAREIARFMASYAVFQATLLERGGTLRAVESMGSGEYHVVLPNGRTLEASQSLLGNPPFDDWTRKLLAASPSQPAVRPGVGVDLHWRAWRPQQPDSTAVADPVASAALETDRLDDPETAAAASTDPTDDDAELNLLRETFRPAWANLAMDGIPEGVTLTLTAPNLFGARTFSWREVAQALILQHPHMFGDPHEPLHWCFPETLTAMGFRVQPYP